MTGTFKLPIVATPQIKTDGTAPTDLTIVTGAAKTMVLDTPVYDDIIINAMNLRGGGTPPAYEAFISSIYGVAFKDNATDLVYGSFELPHTYKEGTDLEVHLHWSPSSTNTGDCVFIMKYAYALMGGAFTEELEKTFTQAGSGTALLNQYVSADSLIDGTTLKIGAIFLFALSRPTGDAFTGDAFLHQVGVHYEIDTMGSRQISSK